MLLRKKCNITAQVNLSYMKLAKIFVFFTLIASIFAISGFGKENSQPIKFFSPEKGIYITDINTKFCPDCISVYLSDSLETVENVAVKTNSAVVINAGFFDPTNTQTTSYVVINGQIVADPSLNSHLMNNPALKEHLPIILNRSEFRIMNCEGQQKFDIALHNQLPPDECKINYSAQGGPELVPDFNLSKEGFVVKKRGKIIRQSAGALGKYTRSAIGIKEDHILLVAANNQATMTLEDLAKFMKKQNVEKAMAFDGGSSTSLYVNLPDYPEFILTSAKNNSARRVKSMILWKD